MYTENILTNCVYSKYAVKFGMHVLQAYYTIITWASAKKVYCLILSSNVNTVIKFGDIDGHYDPTTTLGNMYKNEYLRLKSLFRNILYKINK